MTLLRIVCFIGWAMAAAVCAIPLLLFFAIAPWWLVLPALAALGVALAAQSGWQRSEVQHER